MNLPLYSKLFRAFLNLVLMLKTIKTVFYKGYCEVKKLV